MMMVCVDLKQAFRFRQPGSKWLHLRVACQGNPTFHIESLDFNQHHDVVTKQRNKFSCKRLKDSFHLVNFAIIMFVSMVGLDSSK
jgi:hypothetical protein